MKFIALAALIFVTACGADGDPFVPTADIGLSAGPSGVSTSAGLGLSNGTLSLGLSL